MGFAEEALSDDGSLTGRGHPWIRGLICGLMTAAGSVGHTLPSLISNFNLATWLAGGVVAAELGAISWVRHRYMDSPWFSATLQVVIGGLLVFVAGVIIGSSQAQPIALYSWSIGRTCAGAFSFRVKVTATRVAGSNSLKRPMRTAYQSCPAESRP
jgi:hypothetical protein